MNSKINRAALAVATLLGAVVLSGCNAVEDVRSEPSTPLPSQQVVLEGKVYGLGIRRSITLQNGTANGAASRVVQGVLGEPIGSQGRETRFSFGALLDGDSYNVNIKPGLVPFGKLCVVNHGTGTLHYIVDDPLHGAPQDVEVVCTDDPGVVRRDIRVSIPDAFRTAVGARVTLMTEEGVFEQDPKDTTDGDPSFVWFRQKLLTLPASGVLPFQNIIKAYTETGSTAALKLINRCGVANHTFPSPVGTSADVTNVAVGECTFAVGGADTASNGAVRYSRPVGVATDSPMGAGGVTLELRYPNGNPIPAGGNPTSEVNITTFGGSFTFPGKVTSGAECPVVKLGEAPIPCEVRGYYEVVIKSHPAGQRCIVASSTVGLLGPMFPGNPSVGNAATFSANTNWAGSANLYLLDESVATGVFPITPSDYTGLRVYCRNLPAAGRVLTGTYQMTKQDTLTLATNVVTASNGWSPSSAFRRVYSHVLTFYPDGTFLFGAHTAGDTVNATNVSNHTERGFYDWDPANVGGGNVAGAKLRFTIHVDGNTGAATAELANGLSSAEGPTYTDLILSTTPPITACTLATTTATINAPAVRHQVLTGVTISGSPKTLKGRFGPDAGPTPRCAVTAGRDVTFVEPRSLNGQMTGTWITQDYQRFWTYDFDSTFGFHAGTAGGFANIQDNCFKLDDVTASSGLLIPSSGGAAVNCAPVGNLFNSNQGSLAHSPLPLLQNRLPGWDSWMPGGELGGGSTARSPSPVYFVIAPATTFAATADPAIFPAASIGSTTWCTTEILGVRGTQNGELVATRKPLYFCRSRTN